MPTADASAAAAREGFAAMTRTLGLALPDDRVEAIYQGFLALRAMTADLRRPRTAAAEPAGIFVPESIIRGSDA